MNRNEITSPLRSSLLLLPSPLGARTKAPRERRGPRGPPCSPLLLLSPRRASQPPRLRWALTVTQSSPALFLLPGMLFPADISVAHKPPLSGIGAKPAVVTQNSPGWGGGHGGGVSETCWAYKDTPNLQGQRAHLSRPCPAARRCLHSPGQESGLRCLGRFAQQERPARGAQKCQNRRPTPRQQGFCSAWTPRGSEWLPDARTRDSLDHCPISPLPARPWARRLTFHASVSPSGKRG